MTSQCPNYWVSHIVEANTSFCIIFLLKLINQHSQISCGNLPQSSFTPSASASASASALSSSQSVRSTGPRPADFG
jgi:hypothetical protein